MSKVDRVGKMRRRKVDGSQERAFLRAFVTSKQFLSGAMPMFESAGNVDEAMRLLDQPMAKRVVKWCKDYFDKYGDAPGRSIEPIFQKWVEEETPSESEEDATRDFLESLSEEHDKGDKAFNVPHLVDAFGDYLDTQKMVAVNDELTAAISRGRTEDAIAAITNFRRVKTGGKVGFDPFTDEDVMRRAFAETEESLITALPRPAKKFFDGIFRHSTLIGVTGVEKMGKTNFCVEFVFRALRSGLRVAFFQLGDLPEQEMMRRVACRMTNTPLWSRQCKTGVAYPVAMEMKKTEKGREAFVEHETRKFEKAVTEQMAVDSMRRARRKFGISDSGVPHAMFACVPSGTLSVKGADRILERWEQEHGFSADVCIAEGSQVLTDRGLVAIESVLLSDKVWDGENFVNHKGVIYKGEKDVINYAGITATPDHQVWTNKGWRSLESCRQMRLRIAQTGFDGRAVRLSEGNFRMGESSQRQWEELSTLRSGSLYQMQTGNLEASAEFETWYSKRMSKLSSVQTFLSKMAKTAGIRYAPTLFESKESILEALWWSWNSISFHFSSASLFVDIEKSSKNFGGREFGIGSNRQRSSLRTGKSSPVDSYSELLSHSQITSFSKSPQIQNAVSRSFIQKDYVKWNVKLPKDETIRSSQSMEHSTTQRAKVYDILDAGPFHRFTVQGLLVHNCIFDYGDLFAPENPKKEKREQVGETWQALSRLRQERNMCIITPTQAKATAYKARKLTQEHFSESKVKNAEVTAMIGLQQTEAEGKMGVQRWNLMNVRGISNDYECLYVARCVPLGMSMVLTAL